VIKYSIFQPGDAAFFKYMSLKNKKTNQMNEEAIKTNEVSNQILELYTKVSTLDYSNKKEADKQYKGINIEIKRLEKIRKKYYKEKIAKLKKKQQYAK